MNVEPFLRQSSVFRFFPAEHQDRVRSLILVRRIAAKPQQHQHEQKAIMARSELALGSLPRE